MLKHTCNSIGKLVVLLLNKISKYIGYNGIAYKGIEVNLATLTPSWKTCLKLENGLDEIAKNKLQSNIKVFEAGDPK